MKFYQDKKKIEFSVGLFVIVALLILIFCYGWLSELISRGNFQTVKVLFINAGNVEIGNTVSVLGVKRGRVKNIYFHENQVLIELLLSRDVSLNEDASFHIVESNIMGDVQVEVHPGIRKNRLDLNLIHQGKFKYSMSSLLSEFSEVTRDLKTLISSGSSNNSFLSNITTLSDTAGSLVGKLNRSFDKNSEKIDLLIENVTQLTTNLNELIRENLESIDNTIALTENTVSHFDSTLIKIDMISDDLHQISDQISSGQGTLGKLTTDPLLYDNLIRVTESADSLLMDIKENPKRYFKVKIF